jgi:hypothetical protein
VYGYPQFSKVRVALVFEFSAVEIRHKLSCGPPG